MKRREFLKSLGVFIAAPSLPIEKIAGTVITFSDCSKIRIGSVIPLPIVHKDDHIEWTNQYFDSPLPNNFPFASEEESKKALSVLAWNFKNTGWRRIN